MTATVYRALWENDLKLCRMRCLLLLTVLLAGAQVPAATDSMPAPSNLGNAEYPRIASDLRVTFRLNAPGAKHVKLEGGAGLVKEPIEMTRGEDGAWSVTTQPAVPDFHEWQTWRRGLHDFTPRLFRD